MNQGKPIKSHKMTLTHQSPNSIEGRKKGRRRAEEETSRWRRDSCDGQGGCDQSETLDLLADDVLYSLRFTQVVKF